jgi:hypothetical protein
MAVARRSNTSAKSIASLVVDRDQSDERIGRILHAATTALSRKR